MPLVVMEGRKEIITERWKEVITDGWKEVMEGITEGRRDGRKL